MNAKVKMRNFRVGSFDTFFRANLDLDFFHPRKRLFSSTLKNLESAHTNFRMLMLGSDNDEKIQNETLHYPILLV